MIKIQGQLLDQLEIITHQAKHNGSVKMTTKELCAIGTIKLEEKAQIAVYRDAS